MFSGARYPRSYSDNLELAVANCDVSRRATLSVIGKWFGEGALGSKIPGISSARDSETVAFTQVVHVGRRHHANIEQAARFMTGYFTRASQERAHYLGNLTRGVVQLQPFDEQAALGFEIYTALRSNVVPGAFEDIMSGLYGQQFDIDTSGVFLAIQEIKSGF